MKIKCINWFKFNNPLLFSVSGYNLNRRKCVLFIEKYESEVYAEVSSDNYNEADLNTFIGFLKNNSIQVNKAKCQLVEKYSLYGYLRMLCYKLSIKSGYLKKNYVGIPFQFKFVNEDVDEKVKFVTERRIKFCGWIEIRSFLTEERDDLLIYTCQWNNVFPLSEDDVLHDLEVVPKTLYFDIECEELKEEADEDEDCGVLSSDNIIQISLVCSQGENVSVYLLSLFPIEEDLLIPDNYDNILKDRKIIAMYCKTQKMLLLQFFNILSCEDPDILSGYNILEFDWKRIISIAKKVGVNESIYNKLISRTKKNVRWVSKTWESSAFSKKEFFYPEIEGRSNLDVIQHVKRNYRLSSYSLNNVVKTFIPGKFKLDVDYKVIKIVSQLARECFVMKDLCQLKKKIEQLKPYKFFDLIEKLIETLSKSSTVESFLNCLIYPMSIIGRYCIVDSLLCLELMNKLQILTSCEEISNCTYVTLEDTLCRGNQYRIFNLLYNRCYFNDILLNKPEGKFEKMNNELRGALSGALVLDPVCGHHKGVITLDFASLYPSIIMNYNLCYTTFSLCSTETTRSIKTREGEYHFEKVREGVLPQLERSLIQSRKLVKERLKTESRPFLRQVLDCRQNALKITANSMYGALAVTEGGRRLLVPAAACITSIGRNMLSEVRNFITEKGFEVIYGDTDSNIIKLPTSNEPFTVYDSKTFEEHLLTTLKRNQIEYHCKDDTFYFVDILKSRDLLKEVYSLELEDDGKFTISKVLEHQATNIGRRLAQEVTSEINRVHETTFDLEYENCFEHYLLIGKKYYVGKMYGSDKLIKKGVLSVKRTYADIEKKIYDSLLNTLFDNSSPEHIIGKLSENIQEVYTNSFLHEFIVTSSFKSLRSYASKLIADECIYIDSECRRFETKEKLDPRFHFEKLPVNARVALKIHQRGEMCPENSRLEYVFYKTSHATTKGEMAIDFLYFYRNKEFLSLNKLVYLNRLINPIEKLLETSSIDLRPIPSIMTVHCLISDFFHIPTPILSDIVIITSENNEGKKRKLALSEIETMIDTLQIRYSDLENIGYVREKIKASRPHEKLSVLISKEPIAKFERKIVKLCRQGLREGVDDITKTLFSRLNSHYVLELVYKKHGVKVSKKKRSVCLDLVTIHENRSKLNQELTSKYCFFK